MAKEYTSSVHGHLKLGTKAPPNPHLGQRRHLDPGRQKKFSSAYPATATCIKGISSLHVATCKKRHEDMRRCKSLSKMKKQIPEKKSMKENSFRATKPPTESSRYGESIHQVYLEPTLISSALFTDMCKQKWTKRIILVDIWL